MIDCLILGDSIAVGTQQHKTECTLSAKNGMNSWQFNKLYPQSFHSNTVIISLGSNDHAGVRTKEELENLRKRISPSSKVYWVLPAVKPNIQSIIQTIATEYKDTIVPIPHTQSDGIHPSTQGYKKIVQGVF